MSSGFVSILKDIGSGLKKFFTSPIAADIETDGLDLAEIAWPSLTPLLNGLKSSIATAQTLAAAANTSGETTSQVTALVLADAQEAFNAYQTATGTTIETAQQEKIVQAFLALLDSVPSSAASPAPAPAPAPAAVAQPTPLQQAIATLIAPTPADSSAGPAAPAPAPAVAAVQPSIGQHTPATAAMQAGAK